MTNSRKDHSLTHWIGQTESVRLTNGLIALTTRLFTSSALALARLLQRRRSRW